MFNSETAKEMRAKRTEKDEESLKHCFHVIGIDRMAPTTKVRELKKVVQNWPLGMEK